jgi:hypothetical protein
MEETGLLSLDLEEYKHLYKLIRYCRFQCNHQISMNMASEDIFPF